MADTLRVEKMAAPLRQRVVDNLRNAITSGRFKAGDRLVERELCEAVGVSRTLVREALRQLEAEGLVTVVANKGPVVASVSTEEARGIYEVRAVLEGLASRLFAERASSAQKAELGRLFGQFKSACLDNNLDEASAAKSEFYIVLFRGAGNAALESQLSHFFARTSLLRSLTLSSPNRLRDSAREIEEMYEAIMSGDGDASWKASVAHVQSAAAVMLRLTETGKTGAETGIRTEKAKAN